MGLLDTKTSKPWPLDMTNLKLQEIRQVCCDDLRKRDEARGIENGKLTTTVGDPKVKDKMKEVVDVVKQHLAHTGHDLNTLLEARWAEYCSKPQDLDAFIATTRRPQEIETAKVKEAASGIEQSLKEPNQVPVSRPVPQSTSEEPPKRGPGRPRKPESVEA